MKLPSLHGHAIFYKPVEEKQLALGNSVKYRMLLPCIITYNNIQYTCV